VCAPLRGVLAQINDAVHPARAAAARAAAAAADAAANAEANVVMAGLQVQFEAIEAAEAIAAAIGVIPPVWEGAD